MCHVERQHRFFTVLIKNEDLSNDMWPEERIYSLGRPFLTVRLSFSRKLKSRREGTVILSRLKWNCWKIEKMESVILLSRNNIIKIIRIVLQSKQRKRTFVLILKQLITNK